MTKDEFIKILMEKYGFSAEDLKGKTYRELMALLSSVKRKERQVLLDSLEESYDSDDGVDLYPNGRDFDADDEDSW